MKNFKKFAVALVAVVLVILVGVFFKEYWQRIVGNVVVWICGLFGLTTPAWVTKFQTEYNETGLDETTANKNNYQ